MFLTPGHTTTMASLEEQLPPLAEAVQKAGDVVKQLKESGAPKDQIDAAVKELKRTKAAMDVVTKAIAAQNANPFEPNREGLEDMCKRRFFYRPAFEIYGYDRATAHNFHAFNAIEGHWLMLGGGGGGLAIKGK